MCAPSQVATPPASATARSCASSVSWSSPYPDFASKVVVPACASSPTCSASRSASSAAPAARVARPSRGSRRRGHAAPRTMRPPARSENSSTRSPAKHACVWQSTRPGTADRAPSVDLNGVAGRREVAHAPDRDDATFFAEHVAVLDHRDVSERGAAKRRARPGRRGDLREVADQESRRPHGLTRGSTAGRARTRGRGPSASS